MDIPKSILDKLAPEALRELVHGLITPKGGRRAGVNVALIIQTLLGGELGSGAEQASLYQALRVAVQQQIEALPDLCYVQGLT